MVTAFRASSVAACIALLSIILSTCLGSYAQASMVLDRTVVRFDADQPNRQDVQLSNASEETLYIQIEVFEVRDPGTAAESNEAVTDPKAMRLLATPNKLIVPPRGRKLIRLVNIAGHDDQERVFRVNVTPITGPIETRTNAVKIVVAYQLLVIVPPVTPAAEIVTERNGRNITLVNQGNTNILLFDGVQCEPGHSADQLAAQPSEANNTAEGCTDLEPRRLYAGNRWTMELPFDTTAQYTVAEGERYERREF